jgi:catechol 2,3-dioxygenase-like lactoylglutathione lyase family enzyme
VPDLERALDFYRYRLGQPLRWRTDTAGRGLPDAATELVLTTKHPQLEPNLLAVVHDPFDNPLTLLDLSKGRYNTDETGTVTTMVERGQLAPKYAGVLAG